MGFGVGFSYQKIPRTLAKEAERLGLPLVVVPYEVPFIAITKYAFHHRPAAAPVADRRT